MNRVILAFGLCLGLAAPAWGEVGVRESGNYMTVDTGAVKAVFNKKLARLGSLTIGSEKIVGGNNGLLNAAVWRGLSTPQRDPYRLAAPLLPGKDGKAELTHARAADGTVTVTNTWTTTYTSLKQQWRFTDGSAAIAVDVRADVLADTCQIACTTGTMHPFRKKKLTILPEPPRPAYQEDFRRAPAQVALVIEGAEQALNVTVPPPGTEANPDIDRVMTDLDSRAAPAMAVYFKSITPLQKAYHGRFTLTVGKPTPGPGQWQAAEGKPWETGAPVVIVDVWPEKLVNDNHADGKVFITLLNATDQPQAANLAVTMERGLNEVQPVKTLPVTLKPHQRQRVAVPFKTDGRDFGAELVAAVSVDGKVVHRASETIGIATDWKKLFQFSIYYPKGADPGSVQRLRETYMTVYHAFCWYTEDGVLVMDPDIEYISDMGKQKRHPRWFLEFNKACREAGIKTNMYYGLGINGSGPGWELDPTRMCFNTRGQAIYICDIFDPRFRRFLADQFIGSIDMFGWDSVMIDCVTCLRHEPGPFSSYHHRNWKGDKCGTVLHEDPDTAGAMWLEELKTRVRAKHPRFVFMGNGLGPTKGFLNSTGIGPKVYLATEVVLSEIGGGGTAVHAKSHMGLWSNFAECLDVHTSGRYLNRVDGKNLNQFPQYMYIPSPYGGPVTTRTYFSLCFANQLHTYNWWPPEAMSLDGQPFSRYMRFSLRHGEWFYDIPGIAWVQPKDAGFVRVTAPPAVRWQNYVYWRKAPGKGRDLLVHLVNMPPEKYTWRNTRPPVTLRDIPVTVTLPAGSRCTEAWVLSPDREPMARKLAVIQKGDRVELTVPELDHYDLLIVRTQPREGR